VNLDILGLFVKPLVDNEYEGWMMSMWMMSMWMMSMGAALTRAHGGAQALQHVAMEKWERTHQTLISCPAALIKGTDICPGLACREAHSDSKVALRK
jgi:hypothetical protein